MSDIKLPENSQKVNLLVNGPLSSVKITRHQHGLSSNLVTSSPSRAVAAGQIDWWIERNYFDSILENDLKRLSVSGDEAGVDVEVESLRWRSVSYS